MAKSLRRSPRIEARWRQIVRWQERSGMGVRAFCRKHELAESGFYFWRRELQRRQAEPLSGVASVRSEAQRQSGDSAAEPPEPPEPAGAGAAFVAVRVHEPDATGGRIEITLPDGVRLSVVSPVDRAALADVLAVLRFDVAARLNGAGVLDGRRDPSEDRAC